MNRLEFVSSLVQSLAWPVAVTIIVLTFIYRFKDSLKQLIPSIQGFKAKAYGVELEIEREVAQIKADTEQVATSLPAADKPTDAAPGRERQQSGDIDKMVPYDDDYYPLREHLAVLLSLSPVGSILAAWEILEFGVTLLYLSIKGGNHPDNVGLSFMLEVLVKADYVSPVISGLILDQRKIATRVRVVASTTPGFLLPTDIARDYLASTGALLTNLLLRTGTRRLITVTTELQQKLNKYES